jgi:type I restriction enzyme, S subunit
MSSKVGLVNMKQETKHELKPKLRFPEFWDAGDWEEKNLKQLAERITLKNIGAKETHVLTNSAEFGIVNQRDYFDKDIANKGNLESYSIVEKDDYVYNPRISTLAPVGPISKNNIGTGVMSPLYTIFRFKSSQNDFYAHYFKATKWHKYLRHISNSGARHDRMSITNDDFMEMSLPAPCPEEQQKIADCLSSIDDRITAETQKLDTLKAHKKGLMQQLFPAEGETLPKLRFPEFRNVDEWEVSTLGQLVDFQSGGTPSKGNPTFWSGLIPWVSAKDMKNLFLDDTIDHITKIAVQDGAKVAQPGTLLMLTRGMTLLKDIPICILSRPMSFNQDVKALLIKGNVDRRFLAYLMLGYKQRLLSLVDIAGHGTGRLDTDELKAFELSIPQVNDEQQRIADCLASLDDLITAQTQKIDALKTHKKGLMQQLFPALDEVKR